MRLNHRNMSWNGYKVCNWKCPFGWMEWNPFSAAQICVFCLNIQVCFWNLLQQTQIRARVSVHVAHDSWFLCPPGFCFCSRGLHLSDEYDWFCKHICLKPVYRHLIWVREGVSVNTLRYGRLRLKSGFHFLAWSLSFTCGLMERPKHKFEIISGGIVLCRKSLTRCCVFRLFFICAFCVDFIPNCFQYCSWTLTNHIFTVVTLFYYQIHLRSRNVRESSQIWFLCFFFEIVLCEVRWKQQAVISLFLCGNMLEWKWKTELTSYNFLHQIELLVFSW